MTGDAVLWHDVECGAYDIDLPLWRELAEAAAGPVLDIGAGTGRVALDLAARGCDVTAIDTDAELVRELSARGRERGLRVKTAAADARSFDLGHEFALAIAPMQVVQLFGGTRGRSAALASIRRHLRPGALFAAALANPFDGVPDGEVLPPLPDIREADGWVYASRPIGVSIKDATAVIERHRSSISPEGHVEEWASSLEIDLVTPDQLEAEAADCGFETRDRAWISETTEWVGSTVVMLEAV